MRFLSFFLIFVTINSSFCFLFPFYDLTGIDMFFNLGSSLKLSCKVTETYEDVNEIEWGRVVFNNSNYYLNWSKKYKIKNLGYMSTLIVYNTNWKDDGIYFCKYRNQTYNFKAIGNMRMLSKPFKEMCVIEGDFFMLKCVAEGSMIRLTWNFDSSTSDVKFIKRFKNGVASSTLVIKNFDKSHSGNFTCEARHDKSLGVDFVVSSTTFVYVREKIPNSFNTVPWPKKCNVYLVSNKHLHNF